MPDDKKEKLISAETADALIAAHDGDMALYCLYAARHPGADDETAAAVLCRTRGEIAAAREKLGRILRGGKKSVPAPPADEPVERDSEEIVSTFREKAFEPILEEMTRILGAIPSKAYLNTLVDIYDRLGMPPEVILLLLNYCDAETRRLWGSGRRPTPKSISEEAYRWANREIMTIELAEEYIIRREKQHEDKERIKSLLEHRRAQMAVSQRHPAQLARRRAAHGRGDRTGRGKTPRPRRNDIRSRTGAGSGGSGKDPEKTQGRQGMSYDGTILARARDRLDGVREQNAREHETRVMRAYAAKPELRAIDAALRAQMTELVRLTLSGETEKIEALREESLELQRRRGELLRQLGHGEDWLDEIVSCEKCRDSGVYRGGVCDCLKRLYNEELTRDLGVLLRNGDESFEKFDLSLYDEEYRGKMRTVYEIAGAYAENFSPAAGNLLFQGGTGLGKTFLSACVARAVAEKGFSVCYDTASAVVGSFESQKFSRDEEADKRVKRMLSCDLMILDDLGTEMPTPMADSAIYTLINTRLNEEKNTIISTNLRDGELQKRYGAQICSRLFGAYERVGFVGRDIRQIKR